jgi:hypothetical protein
VARESVDASATFPSGRLGPGLGHASAFVLLLALASCATVAPPGESQRCGLPDFPYTDGWLGGDAAYSIPITPDTSLWLFGDSFVRSGPAPDGPPTRRGARFIHNSIALATCTERGEWVVDYAWGTDADGKAFAFLDPGLPDSYWWLFDGFVHADKLYLGLLVVEPNEPRGALNLPFRFSGVKLARIANFRAAPEEWRVEVLPLSDDTRAFPTSTLVVHGDFVYLFAFLDMAADRLPRMLTRLPVAALEGDRPAEQLEYLASSGEWKPGLEAADARLLMEDDASEMTVRFHPELDRWLAVYSYPSFLPELDADTPSDRVYVRTALAPEGPWSEPRAIFHFPELREDYGAGHDPNTFCYAAKEHPQLAPEGELLITYVCNLFTRDGEDSFAVLGRLLDTMYLYRPRAVAIPLSDIPLP